ncbi:hypothetical protein CALCODRAFT_491956 [Calocera cornea HHB12733]|uniref:Uncharacterized protein n=1 Tax=Calocera cornea HHB12733 TaxID=1353952 RepID=A0A165IKS5_9BASI|nr:hypothetical protein CALCODRAFT_491956 [Calocera cornea HHB12733]
MSPKAPSTSPRPSKSPSPTTSRATTMVRGSTPPPRKRTSSPRVSPKLAVIGKTDFPQTTIAPRSDAEHIASKMTPFEFGKDAARRASMPTKYHSSEQTLLPCPMSPAPTAGNSSRYATPLREVQEWVVPITPASTDIPSADDSPQSSEQTLSPRPISPTPTVGSTPRHATPLRVKQASAMPITPASIDSSSPHDSPQTPTRQEASAVILAHDVQEGTPKGKALAPYNPRDGLPANKTARTDWVLQDLYSRLDTLTFNLPGPRYRPIDLDTFRRKGRSDLVEGKTINDIGNLVFTHSRTWNASRCNIQLPRVDPSAKEVKCKVLSDSPNFESPTHVLVLTTGVGNDKTFTYVPVHDMVYLAQCVGLRAGLFPPSHPKRVQEEDGSYSVTLPIVVLHVPANHCFGLLDDYFYHRNLTYFFQQLISPMRPTNNERTFENNYHRCRFYVRLLCVKFTFPQIARRLLAIHHLHQDAVHLGVVDPSFWRVVNVAWFCCGAALKGKKLEQEQAEALSLSGKRGAGRSASLPNITV